MRIASSQYQSIMNQSIQLNQERLSNLTQQMASGKRIQLPSDDPIDNVRMSRLQREESGIGQYRDNIAAVKIRLTKNEGYMSNMVNEIMSGRDLLVWASDGSNTPDDLAAMVTPLTALRDSLYYSANTVDHEGRYIFSGTATATQAISKDGAKAAGARYSFTGNTNPQLVVVGSGITQAANDNVDKLHELLNKLDETIEKLATPGGVSPNDPAVRTVLSATLRSFDAGLDLISGKIAVMGGVQNILSTLDANHANVSLSNQMALKDIGQLDMGVAATDLNGYSTALQATYKAYSRIGNMSLFDVL